MGTTEHWASLGEFPSLAGRSLARGHGHVVPSSIFPQTSCSLKLENSSQFQTKESQFSWNVFPDENGNNL